MLGMDQRPLIKRILMSYHDSANTMNGPPGSLSQINRTSSPNPQHDLLPLESVFKTTSNRSKRRQHDEGGITENLAETRKFCVPGSVGQNLGNGRSVGIVRLSSEMSVVSRTLMDKRVSTPEWEIVYTTLVGKRIASFSVGGELRLCLPHIITSVLADFTAMEIYSVCTTLNIYLASCTDAQVATLKCAGVLPFDTTRSGLITKTDAERMCNKLLPQKSDAVSSLLGGENCGVDVFHECFGGCRGLFIVGMYTSRDALCIQCNTCRVMFSPILFVSHCHEDPERHACHWGFNAANWRSYLMLARSDPEKKVHLEAMLNDMKSKFIQKEPNDSDQSGVEVVRKRPRLDDDSDWRDIESENNHDWLDAGIKKSSDLRENRCETAAESSSKSLNRFLQALLKHTETVYKRDMYALPEHLHRGEPLLSQSANNNNDSSNRKESCAIPNVSLDPEPYLALRSQCPPELTREDPVEMSAEQTVINHRSPTPSCTAGRISVGYKDDDSIETLSIMSGKLVVDEDDDEDDVVDSEMMTHDLDVKMNLLRSVLEAGAAGTEEVSTKLIHERLEQFVLIQNRHRELFSSLQASQRQHEQEVCHVWEIMSASDREEDKRRAHHVEMMTMMKRDGAENMRSATLERFKLVQDIEALSSNLNGPLLAEMAAVNKKEAEELKDQLQNMELANAKLRSEIAALRSSLLLAQHDEEKRVPQSITSMVSSGSQWFSPNTWIISLQQ